MSSSLRHVTTQDRYVEPTTLRAPLTRRINFTVANAGILYQLAQGGAGHGGLAFPEDEAPLDPGFFSLDRRCDGVRIRSLVPGIPAKASVTALTLEEIGGLE
jgi:hypothetical protein